MPRELLELKGTCEHLSLALIKVRQGCYIKRKVLGVLNFISHKDWV